MCPQPVKATWRTIVFFPSALRLSSFPRLLAALLGILPFSWTFAATVNIPTGSTLAFNVPADPDRREPTATLTISGWSGTAGLSGTQGRILFGNNASALTSGQLAKITFQNFSPGAQLLASGEVVPMAVPEAESLIAALCLASLVAWRERRHLTGWIRPLVP